MAHGEPVGGTITRYLSNHVLIYDCSRKIPLWVAEHLTKDNIKVCSYKYYL